MSKEEYSRTELLWGDMSGLFGAAAAVVGLGGVGGCCAEVLARSGLGKIILIDGDIVEKSDINRQIIALHTTLGRKKVEVAAERIRDINPDCKVEIIYKFIEAGDPEKYGLKTVDYIADCTDDVNLKAALAKFAEDNGINIISCMGTGNKLSPNFKIADVYDTKVCPLAKALRSELRKIGVKRLQVIYSEEVPVKKGGKVGSTPYVPPVAGMTMAGKIILDLARKGTSAFPAP